MPRVAVVGAGSWGTTVAALLAANANDVVLWARREDLARRIATERRNRDYLPELELPDVLDVTADLDAACSGAEVVVLGVPSHGVRSVLSDAARSIGRGVPIVSLAKGVERGTLMRMTEVAADVLVGHPREVIGVLTGPNLAPEIAAGQPAATVIAVPDDEVRARLQQLFMSGWLRVYTNPDVIGCEIAGAAKNVIAIAVGIAAGLGYGDNGRVALITRGLAEITRLGVALGGDPLTFSGLAGVGDLVVTCTSELSRNRAVGVQIGQGRPLAEVVGEMNMVAEGVRSTEAVLALAARHGVDMPLAGLLAQVLSGEIRAADLVPVLMFREAKAELHGIR